MDAYTQVEALSDSSGFAALTRYTQAFDLFKVMGVSSKELVHSNILAAFMSEDEAHGLGASFRDAFVASLSRLPSKGRPLSDLILASTKGVKAKVAWEQAHIDVLLDFPSLRLVIAIENKIWAADQYEQLARYQKALCDLYPNYESRALVYLTPTGRDSPTQDPDSGVPVYFQSYGDLATLLHSYRSDATPSVAYFIGQFVTHVEKTMSGNTELNRLCWEVFQQNEDAYAHLVKHYEFCNARKMTELFRLLEGRLANDSLVAEFASVLQTKLSTKADKHQYDLDIRLREWPEGVWVKVYKHTWFGVFPFFEERDVESLIQWLPSYTQSLLAVPDWAGLYFASSRFLVKDDRCVLTQGDSVTAGHLDEVITRVHDCIKEINSALKYSVGALREGER